PLELYAHPANKFVAGFIGSPAMNFADVTINDTGGVVTAESQGLRLQVPPAKAGALRAYKGQSVAFGVRPEDVHIATGSDPAGLTPAPGLRRRSRRSKAVHTTRERTVHGPTCCWCWLLKASNLR